MEEKRYECNLCSEKFVYRDYKDHMNVHNGIRPYQCDLCDKSFLRPLELKIHKNSSIHAGYKPWECSKCKKCFAQQAHLTAHMRCHTGEKPFKCEVCSRAFAQSSHLNIHKLQHTDEKPHQCKFCKVRFRLFPTLKSHLRTHTGEKPYKCPECPRAFSQYTPMMEHLQKTHENKEYTCNICYKKFPSKQQRQRHKLLHHDGVFRYTCLFCGKGLNLMNTLRDHYRRHFEEKPHFCRYCDKSFYRREEWEGCETRHKRYGQKPRIVHVQVQDKPLQNDKLPLPLNASVERVKQLDILDTEELSHSPPPPQLVRQEDAPIMIITSFEGRIAKSPEKDVNGNNEFFDSPEKFDRLQSQPEDIYHDITDDDNVLAPHHEQEMEIEDSVTRSPPSLDLEGEQDDNSSKSPGVQVKTEPIDSDCDTSPASSPGQNNIQIDPESIKIDGLVKKA